MEMGGLDYDKILCAYEKVDVKFFYTIQEEHALPILSHAVHDMSSEELILRQSAFRLLLSFIEFSGEILNGSLKSDLIWSEASIQHIVNKFFLKHMGNAMTKEGAVKKVLNLYLQFFLVHQVLLLLFQPFLGSSLGIFTPTLQVCVTLFMLF